MDAQEIIQDYLRQLQHELLRGEQGNRIRAKRLCERLYAFRRSYQYIAVLSLSQQTALWQVSVSGASVDDTEIVLALLN